MAATVEIAGEAMARAAAVVASRAAVSADVSGQSNALGAGRSGIDPTPLGAAEQAQRPDVAEAIQYNLLRGYNAATWQRIQTSVGTSATGKPDVPTVAAVRKWQAAHGLVVDGKVGPNTLTKMLPDPGTGAPTGSTQGGTRPAEAPDLSRWGLRPEAASGARRLFDLVPTTRVTSGRRTREAEAAAWAGNIATNKNWMQILAARRRPDIQACQKWIDDNWAIIRGDRARIAAHLLETFSRISDDEMATISPHANGLALDVAPNPAYTSALLGSLPGVRQVLNESNHWHLGFHPAQQAPGAERGPQ